MQQQTLTQSNVNSSQTMSPTNLCDCIGVMVTYEWEIQYIQVRAKHYTVVHLAHREQDHWGPPSTETIIEVLI